MPAQSDDQYMPAAWGQSLYEDLEMPSGGKILAKRLEFTDIISAGLMDEFDSLGPVVAEKIVGPAKGKKPSDRPSKKLTKAQQAAADAVETRENMPKMVRLLSVLLPLVVVKPVIHASMKMVDSEWVKVDVSERVDGRIYADSIPLPDQMHIFQWAMEGMDMDALKSASEQSESSVGAVEPKPKPTMQTE